MQTLPTELELSHLSATICAELAAGLSTASALREKYQISDEQWERLKANKVFRAMLRESFERLHGDLNAGKRITLKAEIALEDSIPILYSIAHDAEAPSMSRLKRIEQMADLAGRNAKAAPGAAGGGGSGFAINIQINAGDAKPAETITINATPTLAAPEEEAA